MDVTITTRHCDVSDQTKGYIDREINGLTKYYNRIIGADVTLTTEKHRQIAEIRMKINNGTIFGKSESSDLRTSFDQAVEKLAVQLKKAKSSRLAKRGARDKEMLLSSRTEESEEDEDFLEED